MALQVTRRLCTVDEYYQMAAIGSRHAGCVDRLTRFFVLHVVDQAIAYPQQNQLINAKNRKPCQKSVVIKLTCREKAHHARNPLLAHERNPLLHVTLTDSV